MYQKVVKNKRQKKTFSKLLERNNIHVIIDNSLFFYYYYLTKYCLLFIHYSLVTKFKGRSITFSKFSGH